ncbi:hypothetical protein ACRAWF_24745 [Streptomyces sp. L7]
MGSTGRSTPRPRASGGAAFRYFASKNDLVWGDFEDNWSGFASCWTTVRTFPRRA